MSKTRIYYNHDLEDKVELIINESQSHYLVNVLKKRVGDEVFLFNEKNGEWLCAVKTKNRKNIILSKRKKTKSKNDVRPMDLWICFGIIKPKNINYLIQKVSEIGISKILPVKTEFSEKIDLNYQRLNKIAIEAVEQSEGILIPKILPLKSIEDLFKDWDKDRKIIVCDETKNKINILEVVLKNKIKKVAIFIGPIAGWSKKDREFLNGQNPFFVSLGNTLLKADTAAIFATSCFKIAEGFRYGE